MLSHPEPEGPADPPKKKKRARAEGAGGPSSKSSPPEDGALLGPERCNPLLLSFLSFFLIASAVWLISGGKRYREEYAVATQPWRVGTTRAVELTLVRSDKTNLACAAEHAVAGLRCAYGRDQQALASLSADKPEMLQPYNTVGGELLLGAGLWTNPDMKQSLPSARFSVTCNYNIKGLMKSASIRFESTAPFRALDKSVTVGTLTDCVLPR